MSLIQLTLSKQVAEMSILARRALRVSFCPEHIP